MSRIPSDSLLHLSAGRRPTSSDLRAPLVSVIVPTYNRRVLLAETLESYELQSYPNIEVVVVDDESSDGTPEFLATWEARDSTRGFRWAQQRNSGPSAARNTGLSLINGEFVKFEDDDDTMEPNSISAFVSTALATEADLCISSRRFMAHDGKKLAINYSPPLGLVANPMVRFFNLDLLPQTGLWFFRRAVFLAGYEWDTTTAREDTDLISRILVGGASVAGAPEAALNYRVGGPGRVSSKHFERDTYARILRSYESLCETMIARNCPADAREAYAASLSRTAIRLWGINREQSLATHALAQKAFPGHRFEPGPLYPAPVRSVATALWSIGGFWLTAPAFTSFNRLQTAYQSWRRGFRKK